MMGHRPFCYIPSFVKIVPLVPGKKIFKGFLPYMGMAQRYLDVKIKTCRNAGQFVNKFCIDAFERGFIIAILLSG